MSLTNIWIQTRADGLVRADQVSGIEAHRTPALAGKPSRWLLDIVLPAVTGSGTATAGEGPAWALGPTHRTMIQTPDDPGDAPTALARLLAQLDPVHAAGVITAAIASPPARASDSPPGDPHRDRDATAVATTSRIRFQFHPFPHPPTASHDTEAHYL
ncbi:hypothetical protein [Pseudonocardia endophytica]|uniref:Uncharacterized protein n=1 Tax=Pseudonocardia endophytica TaxID=401976 RepID=A0A4V2PHK3_PSEEN|nr:hypothetical protein [Pseudonocardia endophytica]TCK21096.1 hypothetical protein EV378_5071 [Pseudonocardia endophytica]